MRRSSAFGPAGAAVSQHVRLLIDHLDLPAEIDLVLITHTHQDHLHLETLLQLRYKVGTVVVGRNLDGLLEDPSPRLMLGACGFEKVRDRQVWDFALVNVASALKLSGSTISDARVVVGAVAAVPKRLPQVEAAVIGQPRNEATAERAGALATEGAVTLRYNGYKVPLMRNLVKRAIRGGAQTQTT